MARISLPGLIDNVVPFVNQVQIDVSHTLGRFPFIYIIHKVNSGSFGFGDFEAADFGEVEIDRPLERVNWEAIHFDYSSFRVIFNNLYEGEVHYF